jgi:hypothetical protein
MKVWPEAHQNLNWPSEMEGTSKEFKIQKWFTSSPRYIDTGQKNRPKNIMQQSL